MREQALLNMVMPFSVSKAFTIIKSGFAPGGREEGGGFSCI
jgi:hypothetical protein